MKTILLLTDFTERATRAADLALELCRNSKANLLLYNSVILLESGSSTADKQAIEEEILKKEERSSAELVGLSEYLKSKLMPREARLKINVLQGTGQVKQTINQLVSDHQIWLIVMGHHIRELKFRFSDSNISSVVGNAGCPVVLVP